MTKRQVKVRFVIVMAAYAGVMLLAVLIKIFDTTRDEDIYSTFKDMIPLLIAIPAVWLGHTLQRRNSYLRQLRILWSSLINAKQSANQYLHIENPTDDDFAQAIIAVSSAIEEVRGVFKNIDESPTADGLYPFEPIKQMHTLLLEVQKKAAT